MNIRIKKVRTNAGLTQQTFADRLGISRNFINYIETGSRVPSDRTIKDICEKFNVNEEWLRTGEGSMNVELTRNQELQMLVNNVMREQDESFKKDFTTALLKMSPEGWKALEQFVKDFNEMHSE